MADAALIEKLRKADLMRRLNAAQQPVAAPQAAISADGTLPRSDVEDELPGVASMSDRPATEQEVADSREYAKDLVRHAAKGATFGAMPRIEGLMRSGFGLYGSYGKSVDEVNKEYADFEEENPKAAIAAELIGGILVPGSVANAARLGTRGRVIARAAGLSKPWARRAGMAVAAAPAGAAYGAMSSSDLTDIPQTLGDAAAGAAGAAVLGPAVGAAADGVKAVARGVRGAVGFATNTGARQFAARRSADVFEGRGLGTDATPRASWETSTRRSVADFDAAAANTDLPHQDLALAYLDPALSAEAMKVAQSGHVSAQPYREMATRATDGQTQRLAEDIPEMLMGRRVNHRQFMEDTNDAATTAFDAEYNQIRAGFVGGRAGNIQINGMRQLLDTNPALHGFLDGALDEAVAARHITRAQADQMLVTPNNLHPYVVERLYHNLSQATHAGDGVARGLHGQFQQLLAANGRGRSMLSLKERHSDAFATRDAADAGQNIWGTNDAARAQALTDIGNYGAAQHAAATEAAAGSLGARLANDAGNFTRPRQVTANQNARTIEEMYGQQALETVQDRIRREQHAYDLSGEIARTLTHVRETPDALANLAKAYVQYQFTPSVAAMNLLARGRSGYSKHRLAEMARMLTSNNPEDRALVRAELMRRDGELRNKDMIADWLSTIAGARGSTYRPGQKANEE